MPIMITTKRDIVLDTTINPIVISSIVYGFSVTVDNNVKHLVNKVKELEKDLATRKQEIGRLCIVVQYLSSLSSDE